LKQTRPYIWAIPHILWSTAEKAYTANKNLTTSINLSNSLADLAEGSNRCRDGRRRSAVQIYNTNDIGGAAEWDSRGRADAGSWLRTSMVGQDASSKAEDHYK